jgi:hypothetical protein
MVLNFLHTDLLFSLETLLSLTRSIQDKARNYGYRNLSYSAVEKHNIEGSRYETLVDSAQDLVDAIEFVISSITRTREEISPRADDSNTSPANVSEAQEEFFERIHGACTQLSKQASRIQAYNERRYNLYVSELNIRGSLSVKRLTALATGFLPLSLGASLLAMDTRFANLNFLLYDFVGVGLLLFFLMFIVYFLLKQIVRTRGWRPFGEVLLKVNIQNMKLNSYERRRQQKLQKGARLFEKIKVIFGGFAGTYTVISFLVGMFASVSLGLRVWGYGIAGMLVLPIGLLSFAVALRYLYNRFTKFWAKRRRGASINGVSLLIVLLRCLKVPILVMTESQLTLS